MALRLLFLLFGYLPYRFIKIKPSPLKALPKLCPGPSILLNYRQPLGSSLGGLIAITTLAVLISTLTPGRALANCKGQGLSVVPEGEKITCKGRIFICARSQFEPADKFDCGDWETPNIYNGQQMFNEKPDPPVSQNDGSTPDEEGESDFGRICYNNQLKVQHASIPVGTTLHNEYVAVECDENYYLYDDMPEEDLGGRNFLAKCVHGVFEYTGSCAPRCDLTKVSTGTYDFETDYVLPGRAFHVNCKDGLVADSGQTSFNAQCNNDASFTLEHCLDPNTMCFEATKNKYVPEGSLTLCDASIFTCHNGAFVPPEAFSCKQSCSLRELLSQGFTVAKAFIPPDSSIMATCPEGFVNQHTRAQATAINCSSSGQTSHDCVLAAHLDRCNESSFSIPNAIPPEGTIENNASTQFDCNPGQFIFGESGSTTGTVFCDRGRYVLMDVFECEPRCQLEDPNGTSSASSNYIFPSEFAYPGDDITVYCKSGYALVDGSESFTTSCERGGNYTLKTCVPSALTVDPSDYCTDPNTLEIKAPNSTTTCTTCTSSSVGLNVQRSEDDTSEKVCTSQEFVCSGGSYVPEQNFCGSVCNLQAFATAGFGGISGVSKIYAGTTVTLTCPDGYVNRNNGELEVLVTCDARTRLSHSCIRLSQYNYEKEAQQAEQDANNNFNPEDALEGNANQV